MSAQFDATETLLSAMDWKKYSVEGWLEQYGNWVNSGQDRGVRGYPTPCGEFLMRNVQQHRSVERFGACNIEDWEARAVGRLIIDLGGHIGKLIVMLFELGYSYREAAEYFDTSTRKIERAKDFAIGWMAGVMGLKEDYRGFDNGEQCV